MKKQNQGITLIALVITVIVLLILAGVTIVTLTGDNGLLQKATTAKHANEESGIFENIKLAYGEYQIAKYDGTDKTAEEIIEKNLKVTYGNNIKDVKVKNEKVKVDIDVNNVQKTYIYKADVGEAYEYKDLFDYKGKEKNKLVPGDEISLTKGTVTESFTVVSNKNEKIVAMPKYNITITTDHPVQSSSAGTVAFSSTNYWAKETGWNDSGKVKDNSVNIDMTAKNEDKTYKNNIQQYIDAYKETLEDMGAEKITVRACTKPELDSELGAELEIPLTDVQKNRIRNPSLIGIFWVGSGASTDASRIWFVSNGMGISVHYYNGYGVRPVIEIPIE